MKLVKSRLPSFLFGVALSAIFIFIFLKERKTAREAAGLNKKYEFELALEAAPSVRSVSFVLPVLDGKQSFFHRERPNRLVLFYSPSAGVGGAAAGVAGAVGATTPDAAPAKDKFNLVKEFSAEEFAANNFLLTSERERVAGVGGGAELVSGAEVGKKYLIQGELTYCIDPAGNMCVYKKVSLTLDVSGVGASGVAAHGAGAKPGAAKRSLSIKNSSVIKLTLPGK